LRQLTALRPLWRQSQFVLLRLELNAIHFSRVNISISRDGVEIGEWTEEEVRAFYSEGRLVASDLYWRDGMIQWESLASFIKPPPPRPSHSIQPPPALAIPEQAVSLLPVEATSIAGFKTRYAARAIDTVLILIPTLILYVPIAIIIAITGGNSGDIGSTAWMLVAIGATIAFDLSFIIWDTLWLGTLGTTPGKLIFGIKVISEHGQAITMAIAWKRVLRLFYSLAFLILFPLATCWVAISKEKDFLRTGTTPWDKKAGTKVVQKKIGAVRNAVGIILFIFSALFWFVVFGMTRMNH
jgi:uncharacterized RDD family membrane protein YckC